jgi:glycine reductase
LEVVAETLSQGDPSFVGPLAGVSLRLSLFHILERGVLEIVPEDSRLNDLEMLSVVVDQEQLVLALDKYRQL